MHNLILNTLQKHGFSAHFLRNDPHNWTLTEESIDQVPIFYQQEMITFQNLYFKDQETTTSYDDLSMIITSGNRNIALWPLSYIETKETKNLTSQESAVKSPIFINDVSEKTTKKALDACLDTLIKITPTINNKELLLSSRLPSINIDTWHRKLMDKKASISIKHELFIDCSLPLDAIKRNFRKSYKSLINRGAEYWEIDVIEDINKEAFDEFQQLHFAVSQRKTRNQNTWDYQHQIIGNKKAVLITMRDRASRKMIGASLFQYTPWEGMYSVAAYNRNLYDKGVSHVIQFEAIKYLKEKNIRWYYIGRRPYTSDQPKPSEKELQIAYFKEGFATHIFPSMHFTLRTSKH
ncbi:hypothetical protein IMCC1989_1289 [gamma proteobacterium IMCC1989]|nr:hypothetical protein IMCC1989_1289 [gamma proteobacterium IMCC1989]